MPTASLYRVGPLPVVAAILLMACEAESVQVFESPASLNAEPLELVVAVQSVRPHDRRAFTQGLLLVDGELYESTGQYGRSSIRRVNPRTGEVERRYDLPPDVFGEGLARVGERLYQLTWHRQQALIYDLESLDRLGTIPYSGQGWGLCFDSAYLVRSDGTERLFFHDPESFEVTRVVRVSLRGEPLARLNELECAEGWIYANVWRTDTIVRIDGQSGEVRAVIDASSLLTAEERPRFGVLNGIAYDPTAGTFLLTGKNWSKLFEVTFVERDRTPS